MTSAPVHHSINYVELAVTDMKAAEKFYSDSFGWTFSYYGPGYAGFVAPGSAGEAGGIYLAEEPRPVGGPFVILYSDDLEATERAIVKAGGTITVPAYDFPGGRRFHCADPAGNEFGVWSHT